jgi:hypothetical protein
MDDYVYALLALDDGSGPALYAGGTFTTTGGVAARGIARWDGASWAALPGDNVQESVLAMTVFDDGGGPALYRGGSHAAKWTGSGWSILGSPIGARALQGFDDGSGPALYVTGSTGVAEGVSVWKWNGSGWEALGSGLGHDFNLAHALAVFDDGTGPALYVGGGFSSPNPQHIAMERHVRGPAGLGPGGSQVSP